MSKQLTTPVTWDLTPEKLKVLEQAGIIPKGTPPAQVAVFSEVANRHGLDPFTKEVHLVGYGGNYSVIVGINGMRGRASDTGLHAGTDAPKFNLQPDGNYHTLATLTAAKKMPETCDVTVYKVVSGQRVAFSASVSFKEFTTGRNKWSTMPYQMIMKVAESHALRKAFPRQVSGLYLSEEVGKAPVQDVDHVEVTKPELTSSHPKWQGAIKSVSEGATRKQAEAHFAISDSVWKDLVSQGAALKLQKGIEQVPAK